MKTPNFKFLILALALLFTIDTTDAAEGDTLWTRHYGGSYHQAAYAVCPSGDGGCVAAGYMAHSASGAWNMYALRMTATGDTLWTSEYGTQDFDETAYALCLAGDGGYLLAGSGGPTSDIELRKISSLGNLVWYQHYGQYNYVESAFSIIPAGNDIFLMAGENFSPPGGAYLLEVNSGGLGLWSEYYGEEHECAYSVISTADGGFLGVGSTERFGTNNYDVFAFRTNDSGDTLWTLLFGGPQSDVATSVCPAGDGGYMVAGYTASFGAGSWDMYLIKVSDSGDTLWTRTYGGSLVDEAWAIVPSNDGNFLLAGMTGSFGDYNGDVYLIKVDPDGNLLWSRTHGGAEEDKALSLCSSGDGHYYLAGETASFTTPAYFDAYLLKVDGTVSASEPESPQVSPRRFTLFSCQPNPFNATTILRFELPVAGYVHLEVFDIQGRCVRAYNYTLLPAGRHQITFDASGLASGIYLAKLEAGVFSAVQKLVLLK
jgi:hypothetical protein